MVRTADAGGCSAGAGCGLRVGGVSASSSGCEERKTAGQWVLRLVAGAPRPPVAATLGDPLQAAGVPGLAAGEVDMYLSGLETKPLAAHYLTTDQLRYLVWEFGYPQCLRRGSRERSQVAGKQALIQGAEPVRRRNTACSRYGSGLHITNPTSLQPPLQDVFLRW